MREKPADCIKNPPFHYYLIVSFLVVVIVMITLVTIYDYQNSEKELTDTLEMLQQNTENSVVQSVTLVDNGLEIYDMSLDVRLKDSFEPFLAAYQEAGGDPTLMDLEALKVELGGTMDLYIINEEGVIEFSTCEQDVGLDFSEYPAFYDSITALREGNEFAADRIVKEITTGQERKYAYMPTPDHRYLLELGLTSDALQDYIDKQYYSGFGEDMYLLNPYLVDIRLYDIMGEPIGDTERTTPPELKEFLLKEVIEPRTDVEEIDEKNDTRTLYLMIDLANDRYASDRSVVAELVYSTKLIEDRLSYLLFSHFFIAILAIVISGGFACVSSRYLTKPIRDMVEDIDTIACGNLDHSLRKTRGREFHVLEQSINAMVERLKMNIAKIRKSEDEIREYNENLEEIVARRTHELREANHLANFYLDIMVHDINNANLASLVSLELLMPEVPQDSRRQANTAFKGIQKSVEIIRNVSTIRRLHQEKFSLSVISLDDVIKSEMKNFPDLRIHFSETGHKVLGDDLLPEIFTNLLGNSAKFIDEDGEVTIRVEDINDAEVLVSVEDNGPGIPEQQKKMIFNRFKTGAMKKSGKGLGLYIVQTLVKRYGGNVWADDRVAGRQECGAAIRFTLKKALYP